MSIFSRQSLGLEVGRNGFRLALVERAAGKVLLKGGQSGDLSPDVMRLSFREPNILDRQAFSMALRDAWLRLLTRENRVAVALPDAIGRTMLVDLDTRLRSREEGVDLIRWKLKKSLPVDVANVHLDYQVVEEREDGTLSALVSIVARDVIRQYEEVIEEAGLIPRQVEFSTFSLLRLFADRLSLTDQCGIVMLHGGTLSLMLLRGGTPDFVRTKELVGGMVDANRLFRELNSSFLVYRDKVAGQYLDELFYLAPDDEAAGFSAVLAEASGVEPKRLDTGRFISPGSGIASDRQTLSLMAVAAGAAARSL
jgi:type IV pilus assembly protein PilM